MSFRGCPWTKNAPAHAYSIEEGKAIKYENKQESYSLNLTEILGR